METNELDDIHLLATNVFQNVTTLTPMLRELVINAKQYQKSFQGTCQLAETFVDSLAGLADSAQATQGATKFVGGVLADIRMAYKELEGFKNELMRLFINEIIIPLESKAEQEIISVKASLKGYTQENKVQTEVVEKATQEVTKLRKKTQRKKSKPGKYDERERESALILKHEEQKLRDVREKGLRTALIEERRVYCFVAERMCSFGRGMIAYNNRISNFLNQKIPEWQSVIARPTELPTESELLIKQPSKIDTSTLRRKSEKRGTLKGRPNSVARSEAGGVGSHAKYNTLDTRTTSTAVRVASQTSISPAPPVTPTKAVAKSAFDYPDNKQESPSPLKPPPLIENEESKPVLMPERSKTMNMSLRASLTEQLSNRLRHMQPQLKFELKAIYNHTGQDSSQLTFVKGDLIIPVCEPTSGWQYGENKATGQSGWFPAAYVEKVDAEAKEIDPMSTLPARSSENPSAPSVSLHDDRIKRFSTPNRKYIPELPERDYDSDNSEPSEKASESSVLNGHEKMSLNRAMPTSNSVPEMNIQYWQQQDHGKPVSMSPLAAVMRNSIEENIIPSPPPSASSTEEDNETNYMPPPPPPPDSPNGDETYQSDDLQENPFANIRLKKTVTNDRSSPMVM